MRPTRFDVTGPVPLLDQLGQVHVIAVGGAGMSAVARLLKAHGLTVTGSDAKDSETLSHLRDEGITVWVGHDPAHLEGADTVIVSSAIRDDNVELAAARARGLRVMHRAMGLAVAMGDHRRVAVAGANGKTTTTAMTVSGLRSAGKDPSFAVGGELVSTGSNADLGIGDTFVIEADESDGTFLAYRPDVAVVTNVQPDHLDFYGTFEAVQEAYRAFVDTIRPGGVLVTCVDDQGARGLAEYARGAGVRTLTYGESADADVVLSHVEQSSEGSEATLTGPWEERYRLVLPIPGLHNLLNATAALIAGIESGAPAAEVLSGLRRYEGVRRRLEIKGRSRGVTVIDDYAHNPGKVTALVRTAREMVPGGGRLFVAFQPHLYSRTRDFAAEFAEALSGADGVFVLDVFGAREQPIPGVSGALITDILNRLPGDRQVAYLPDKSKAAGRIVRFLREGDVFVTVGAGDVTNLGPAVLRGLTDTSA